MLRSPIPPGPGGGRGAPGARSSPSGCARGAQRVPHVRAAMWLRHPAQGTHPRADAAPGALLMSLPCSSCGAAMPLSRRASRAGKSRGRGTEQCRGLAELREFPPVGLGYRHGEDPNCWFWPPAPALWGVRTSSWSRCPAGLMLPAHPQPRSRFAGEAGRECKLNPHKNQLNYWGIKIPLFSLP